MPFVTESTGEENANLYKRGVNEGTCGELLDASKLLELLDVFGEDGVRSYLVGYLEGVEDAMVRRGRRYGGGRRVVTLRR